MSKQLPVAFLRLIFCAILLLPLTARAQDECCEKADCRKQVEALLDEYNREFRFLGPCPAQPETRARVLDSIRQYFPKEYKRIGRLVQRTNSKFVSDHSFENCYIDIESAREDDNNDVRAWRAYLCGVFITGYGLLSPEYPGGFGLHVQLHQGAIGLGTASEAYALTLNGFISYTFTHKGQICNGWLRIMLGPAYYYTNRTAYLLANPRLEFRVKDIGSDLLRVGCVKLIAEAQLNDKRQLIGGGIAPEIGPFHLQIGALYELAQGAWQFQTGIGYQNIFRKKPHMIH